MYLVGLGIQIQVVSKETQADSQALGILVPKEGLTTITTLASRVVSDSRVASDSREASVNREDSGNRELLASKVSDSKD